MKKIAFLMCAMCLSLAMSAQSITSVSLITLSSAGQPDKELGMLMSSSFSDGFDNSWDAQSINESGIYVYYQGARYTTWASNAYSQNLPIGFYSCDNNDYTLKFSGFSGEEYQIYDLVANQTINVNAATPNYDFSISDDKKGIAINDRFIINYNPAAFVTSLTTNDYGWASFSYDANLQSTLPIGLKIYKGALEGTETLNLNEVNYVPANTGVIVYGTPNTTYYFAAGTGTSDFSDNILRPTSAYTIGDQNVFVLKGNALLQYTGNTALAANKAYLQLPGTTTAPKRIRMVINQTTSVENVEALEAPVKFVENGQIFIRRGNEVYNLQGQMVK